MWRGQGLLSRILGTGHYNFRNSLVLDSWHLIQSLSLPMARQTSSSPREFHPQALTDPDVSLSAHPAPFVQPEAACQVSANGQTTGAVGELNVLTSMSLSFGVLLNS
jgi:hypothetical protein